MINFAFVDSSGFPTRGGRQRELPENAIVLSAPFTLTDLPRLRYVQGKWEVRTDLTEQAPPTAEEIAAREQAALLRARQQASGRINSTVSAIRERYYTKITGQSEIYLEKRQEAVSYIQQMNTTGEPETLVDYPFMQREIGVTATTPYELAQIWLFMSTQFKSIGSITEGIRTTFNDQIAVATTEEQMQAIETAFYTTISELPF